MSADGSVRVFDLRDKDHSTIIYESPVGFFHSSTSLSSAGAVLVSEITKRTAQKVLTSSRQVDECEPLFADAGHAAAALGVEQAEPALHGDYGDGQQQGGGAGHPLPHTAGRDCHSSTSHLNLIRFCGTLPHFAA